MASILETEETTPPAYSFPKTAKSPLFRGVLAVLKVLASLKITVALFVMAIFIVFVGTLAQTRSDIWDVVHTYFRWPWVWVPFQIFFPKAFFPQMAEVRGGFPFLGGWAIGALMGINLLAAHLTRFKIQAKGPRLVGGLGVIAVGCVVTWLVIAGGSQIGPQSTGVLDPSMRILWQLLQGGVAGAILLAGCWLVFARRAGVVVLHAGVGLMMFSELLVGTTASEAQMHIVEGETVNFVQDIRTNELVVIDTSDSASDTVVAIPQSFLKQDATITNARLPFDIRVIKYMQNSELGGVDPKIENPATAGVGREIVAKTAKASVGTSAGGQIDDSAVYVQILEKGTTQSLGTYLLSLTQSRLNESRERSGMSDSQLRASTGPFLLKLSEPSIVTVDGKAYRLALRFKRIYKPYSLTLHDVRSEKYLGTETPKDYSSIVRVKKDSLDPAQAVDRDNVRIWMNNPLRFDGETFYQSNVGADPITHEETTGLQVVSNAGWMIPYVSCMIVAAGLLFQFSMALFRFLGRLQPRMAAGFDGAAEAIFLAGVLAGCAGLVAYAAWPPRTPMGTMNLYEAGKIPVIFEGRVKPLDTLARNTLQVLSNRETFKDDEGHRQPAIRWLLDIMAGSEAAQRHRVFRIDNVYVLDRLGLEWREGHLYSLEEIRKKAKDFDADVEQTRKKPVDELVPNERKLLELDRRVKSFRLIEESLVQPEFPRPDDEIRERVRARGQSLKAQLADAEARLIKTAHPPLVVPIRVAEGTTEQIEWKPLISALVQDYFDVKVLQSRASDPAVVAWETILTSYSKDEPDEFNQAVANYQALLVSEAPPQLASADTGYEAYFNHFSPLHVAWMLYIVGFVLSAAAWLGWTRPINRAAFWLNVFTLALHTFALLSRIYISGRPPVTNLYSTAPFIGWGCVVLALCLERIFRLGIGNLIATIAGFASLYIASKLAVDGDTFTVLQAVLDTQFWLATHVVVINLGYAATFLAGMFGLLYIGRGILTPSLTPDVEKALTRMMYGTLCFAIFFSFVGTVLGGLWADDSWGRFWGWDPKENGALMIVLWNALVLHARWDGLVKSRGLALLAVGGNIVTAWSWFGVNELGVGLHSYGISEGRVMYLLQFVASQLVVIAIGSLPRNLWWSFNRNRAA